MPLPDESSRPKASDLIKRFQQQVDSSKEAPLVISNSFATPGKPRPSLSAPIALKPESSSPKETSDLQKETAGDGKGEGEDSVKQDRPSLTIDSATAEASASAKRPPLQTSSPTSTSSSPTFVRPAYAHHSHQASLPPIITAPSPPSSPPIAVPGSASLLASPHPSPAHSRNASFDSLPPSPGGMREGLSQPSSPAAESGRLSAPPVRDDSSPPPPFARPSITQEAELESPTRQALAFSSGPLIAEPDSRSPSPSPNADAPEGLLSSLSLSSPSPPPAAPSPSAQQARIAASSKTLSTPTASFLAKTRPPRTTSPSASSPSTSPSRTRTRAPQSSHMSPSTSRDSAAASSSSTASSLRGSSPTSLRTGTPTKSRASTAGAGGKKTAVPTTGTPRSRKAAAEAAAAAAAAAEGKASPSPASSAAPKKTSPTATRSGGTASGIPARGGAPLRMARRGRVGLAGAGAVRRFTGAEAKQKDGEGKSGDGGGSTKDECGDDIPDIPSEAEDEGVAPAAEEKVFKGFGANRPHGRIPIPIETNGEAGELRAVGAEMVDEAASKDE